MVPAATTFFWRMQWMWVGMFMLLIAIMALSGAYDRHQACCQQYVTAIKPHQHTVIFAGVRSRLKAEPDFVLNEPVARIPASATWPSYRPRPDETLPFFQTWIGAYVAGLIALLYGCSAMIGLKWASG